MFSRSEPDVLFPKLLVMLHRVSNIEGCNVEIGGSGMDTAKIWQRSGEIFI